MTSSGTLRHQAVHAAKWSALGELASRLIQPVVFLVMARLLTPEDYGVAGAAVIVLSFSQVFWEAGMGRALVQRESGVEAAADVAFWTNLLLGLCVYGALFAAADPIAVSLFKEARVAPVLRVQGLAVLIGALASVQTAICQRHMDFKSLFRVRMAALGIPALASIPLAVLGYGYWALVAGALVGSAAQAAALWILSPWRPRWAYDRAIAAKMVRFGLWTTASSLLGWFYLWADSLLVGHYLDAATLGRYRAGSLFVATLFSLVLSPIMPVLFSVLSRLQGDRDRLRAALGRATRLMFLVAAPLGALLYLLQDPLAAIVFGSKWAGLGPIIGWCGVTVAMTWTVGANGEAYRAMGRPEVDTTVMMIALPAYLAAYLLSLPHGLESFLHARFSVMALVGVELQLLFASKVLGLNVPGFLGQLAWTALGAAAMLLVGGLPHPAGHWLHLLSVGALAGAVFLVVGILPQWAFLRGEFLALRGQRYKPAAGPDAPVDSVVGPSPAKNGGLS